jgi:hypothetical protein
MLRLDELFEMFEVDTEDLGQKKSGKLKMV